MILQKRSSLLVFRNNSCVPSEVGVAKDTWKSNDKGEQEQGSHDRESENPLESNDLQEELANAESCGQDGERKAHSVVLVCQEEEEAVEQNSPDEDVGHDAS